MIIIIIRIIIADLYYNLKNILIFFLFLMIALDKYRRRRHTCACGGELQLIVDLLIGLDVGICVV